MINIYKKWLINAPISKKFLPIQFITVLLILVIGIVSVFSLAIINSMSQKLFAENVKNTEMLTEITKKMYVCRVLGRDILFEENKDLRQNLYNRYIDAFKLLDLKMDLFAERLEGKKLQIFKNIIIEKNTYKKSMILSANLKNEGTKDAQALEALQVVTPIANDFFGSIDKFLTDEKQLMANVVEKNDKTVFLLLALDALITVIVAFLFFYMIRSFVKTANNSLVTLEQTVTEIANTCNMKIEIPSHLFTNDEIGGIAIATDKLKTMLLDYSFKDALTNGYNSLAYFEELSDIFNDKDKNSQVDFWCIIFDMNNLKLINDHYGHIQGDEAIINAYNTMIECFSDYGKTFRIGGDEFVSILFNCSKTDIQARLDTMVLKIEEKNKKTDYHLSVAWGYDNFRGNTKEEFDECFKIIDKKMYQNKKAVKNFANTIKKEV